MGEYECQFNTVNGENTGAWCRKGPGYSYAQTRVLVRKNCPNGVFKVDNTDGKGNYWKVINPTSYGLSSGDNYVYLNSSFLNYPKDISLISKSATQNTPKSTSSTTNSSNSSKGLEQAIYDMLKQEKSWTKDIEATSRIFAMPFRFTNTTDYRPFTSQTGNINLSFGRKYLENIVGEAPVIFLVPGIPNYMPGMSSDEKSYIDAYIKAQSMSSDVTDFVKNKFNSEDMRYYDFYPAYSEYIRYVNLLCRVSAFYMKIDDKIGPDGTTKYGKYNWGKYSNPEFVASSEKDKLSVWDTLSSLTDADAREALIQKLSDKIFSDEKYIKFYIDSNVSISESNSNSTTESKIASLFDTVEGLIKEVGFFTNDSGSLSNLVDLTTTGTAEFVDSIGSVLDANSSAGISKIIKNGTHVLTGSNVIFPELWADSSYKKSYSFTVNLVSPYGDTESIYLNIIVPMMHLIALSFPRQTSANSFKSPFLVKAFVKGWFASDLAIIDSISIEKGGDGSAWTVLGLPTEVKISVSITDLYSNLMISHSGQPTLFFNNNGLIQFLAVNCGMDISRPNVVTKIESIVSTYFSSLFDVPDTVQNKIKEWFRNLLEGYVTIGQ